MTDNHIDKIVKEVLKSAKLRVKTPFLNELPAVLLFINISSNATFNADKTITFAHKFLLCISN